VRLPGAFNVSNAVGALAMLVTAGVPVEAAVRGIAELSGVPGRMERVDAGQPFVALVDYAHTPEAVEMLLRTVRAVTPGRVIVVLGCGGDRDRGKRPLMGRAAVAGADLAVLTSDNPRSEDPLAILDDMLQPDAVVEPDRAAAIAYAVAAARPGDTVVVAGKGHETGQDVGGVIMPFDDRAVLRAALEGAA
jgi:UDP-N-acetylmuramoyl-L-alanyl-D-glutamate--2,6-diaminopimelate ligase